MMSGRFNLLRGVGLDEHNVADIGGGTADDEIRRNLVEAIECRGYIEKPLFYQYSGWDAVSEESRQTRDECNILQRNSGLIAGAIQEKNNERRSCVIIELGPGDFKKTEVLFAALHEVLCDVLYMAVDINGQNLKKNIPSLNRRWPKIKSFGLWGSFNQALEVFERGDFIPTRRNWHVWSFGSSLSNDNEVSVVNKITRWSRLAECIIVGQDGADDETTVMRPYKTQEFYEFFLKGLQRGGALLSEAHFSEQWDVKPQLRRNPTMHIFTLIARSDATLFAGKRQIKVTRGEELEAFASFKYKREDLERMAHSAGCTMTSVLSTEGIESSRLWRPYIELKLTIRGNLRYVQIILTGGEGCAT